MRQLHPVGPLEKFIASGVYNHLQDGEPTGTTEKWSIHELPDGAQLIRVDEDWRDVDGSSVLLEAWRSPLAEGQRFERFDIHAISGKTGAEDIREVRATFTINQGILEYGRSLNNGERDHFEMELPERFIVSPEGLIFGGIEAARLLTSPDELVPVLSYLPTFYSEAATFRPVIHNQVAQYIHDESVEIGHKSHEANLIWQGVSLSEISLHLWVDPHNTLLKYEANDSTHGAILSQYAHRPEPK